MKKIGDGQVAWMLLAAALAIRLYELDFPHSVVFDELFYTRFIQFYVNGIFFFDSNPPFAKQLIALAAYAGNYTSQEEEFERIGDEYSKETPIFALRLIPAIFDSILVPVAYFIVRNLGYSQIISLIAGLSFLLDNALITGCRFVMTDAINMCFVFSALLSAIKFTRSSPLSLSSLFWGLSCGLLMGTAISSKYLSFPSLILICWIVGRNYWKVIGDLRIGVRQLLLYLAFCNIVVFVIPSSVYIGCFVVHLQLLQKAGPYDSKMSSKFQASLEGGLSSITNGQPYSVAYGSQITLRNQAGLQEHPCWLHSHKDVYPAFYADGRGSSHQQQVTCYSYKDVNNWWIVKHPNRSHLEVDEPPELVKDGDVVQLVHGITGRLLNSHDVAAPLTADTQEVSAYVDYNVSMVPDTHWKLRMINRDPEDPVWHTIQTEIQLVHVNSSTSLSLTGKQLPEWGHNQFEVVSSSMHDKFTLSVWNVEEHRYTKKHRSAAEREAQLSLAEFIPDTPIKMSFWSKFVELQWSMLGLSKDTVDDHVYGSKPLDWVLNDNGVAFWAEKKTNRQIYQVGNNALWHTGAWVLLFSASFLILVSFWRLRYPTSVTLMPGQWDRIYVTAEVVLGGFFINWFPYFFTDRTLFLHHYFPALGFKLLCVACVFGEVLEAFANRSLVRKILEILLAFWVLSVVYSFYRFIPLTYGMIELTAKELRALEWRDSWNFIIRH